MFRISNELMNKIKEAVINAKPVLTPQPAGGPIMFACIGCSSSCSSTCTGACRTGCSSTCKTSSSNRW